MKEYLNRKEYPNGDITVKLVKMGMDIDDTRNHRVRGIIKTEDNKYIFIEISQVERVDRKYTKLSKEEYLKQYPYEEYIFIDCCFRVDVPKDYDKCYSPEFSKYNSHCFYNIEHSKENIIKLLQKFNKNIKDIELVDDYYLDDYCKQKHFYRLFDERLEHTITPIKIVKMYGNKIVMDLEYCCKSYDKSVTCTENIEEKYVFDLESLYKEFGVKKMNQLLSEYKKNNPSKNIQIKDKMDMIK